MCTCAHQLQPHRPLPNVCPGTPPLLTVPERRAGMALLRIKTWVRHPMMTMKENHDRR